MKSHLVKVMVAAVFAAIAGNVQAASGCVKGGAVGAVGGHLMGHHGVAGAAVGCAVGHHQEKKNAKKQQQAANAQQAQQQQSAASTTTNTGNPQPNAQTAQNNQNTTK